MIEAQTGEFILEVEELLKLHETITRVYVQRMGNIIIAEPNAYIAFVGKRVIEQTLNKTIPKGSQAAEYLFHKGLFDPIVPRNLLKGVLNELFQLHALFPLNQNSIK